MPLAHMTAKADRRAMDDLRGTPSSCITTVSRRVVRRVVKLPENTAFNTSHFSRNAPGQAFGAILRK